MAASQIVAVALSVAGAVVALWLLFRSASGRCRVLGAIGTVLILLGLLSRIAFQWMVDRFVGKVDDATIISILAADTLAGGVLIGAGVLLVTGAVVVASRLPKI